MKETSPSGRRLPDYLKRVKGVDRMNIFRLFRKKTSGNIAKDRLKLLLISDRANCSPEIMEMIKNDVIKVISKYMEIDEDGMEIHITQTESENKNGSVPALYANIPIIDLKNA